MNPSYSRLKRVAPERNGPIRNPLFPPPRPVRTPGGNTRQAGEPAGDAVFGALENGVKTAYSVIDDYLHRGQMAARGMYNDSNTRGFMNDYRGAPGGGFNQWNPLAMLTEQWMTAMKMWTQAWSSFMPPGWPQPPWNPPANEGSGPKISVQVSSARPIEVTANLFPCPDMVDLFSDPLRPEGSQTATIDAVSIVREPGSVRVAVKVPADHPPGRYRGFIRKKSDSSVAGEVIAVIS
jgi:hypothetical protein